MLPSRLERFADNTASVKNLQRKVINDHAASLSYRGTHLASRGRNRGVFLEKYREDDKRLALRVPGARLDAHEFIGERNDVVLTGVPKDEGLLSDLRGGSEPKHVEEDHFISYTVKPEHVVPLPLQLGITREELLHLRTVKEPSASHAFPLSPRERRLLQQAQTMEERAVAHGKRLLLQTKRVERVRNAFYPVGILSVESLDCPESGLTEKSREIAKSREVLRRKEILHEEERRKALMTKKSTYLTKESNPLRWIEGTEEAKSHLEPVSSNVAGASVEMLTTKSTVHHVPTFSVTKRGAPLSPSPSSAAVSSSSSGDGLRSSSSGVVSAGAAFSVLAAHAQTTQSQRMAETSKRKAAPPHLTTSFQFL